MFTQFRLIGSILEYSYVGPTGPEFWHMLKPEYAICGSGLNQSPINLPSLKWLQSTETPRQISNVDVTLQSIKSTYEKSDGELVNEPLHLKFNLKTNSNNLELEKNYIMRNIHFHQISEHAVESVHTEMELHAVHSIDNEIAVVGVMVEVGEYTSPFLHQFLNNTLSSKIDEKIDLTVDMKGLSEVINNNKLYHYMGSLTTPPCTENLKWYVSTAKLKCTKKDLGRFAKHLFQPRTNRPIQRSAII